MTQAEGKQDMLLSALSSFKCCLDEDIEDFIHRKAINFIERKWCSTYLLLNEDKFLNGELVVEAYFTLSHKAITVEEGLSKTKIKQVTGFKNAELMQFILIGQIGKYYHKNDEETYDKSQITLNEVLDSVYEVVNIATGIVPSRYLLVECNDEIKEKNIYAHEEFEYFQFDGSLHQYIKKI